MQVSSLPTQDSRASWYKHRAAEILTFDDSPDLLRGVPLSIVMRNGASILGTSTGSSATYNLSDTVTEIRTFFSHNWAVGRWRKFAGLALYFNFDLAVAAMVLVSLFFAALTFFKVLPCIDDHVLGNSADPVPTGFLVRPTCAITFLVALCLGRDILGCLGFKGERVFLDKICIHQTDAAIQRQGISKLGGFLHHSDHMIILFTPLYLTKLWTIYELAAFLLQHPISNLKVIPVNLSVAYCLSVLGFSCGPILILVRRHYNIAEIYTIVVSASVLFAYIVVLRTWAREKVQFKETLHQFSVRAAHCAVPSDRPVVIGNIVALMKAFDRIDVDATEEKAVEAFDLLVRTRLSEVFQVAFGQCSFTYGQVMVLAFVSSLSVSLDLLSGVSRADEKSAHIMIAGAANTATWTFAVYPLLWYGIDRFVSANVHLRGWHNALYLVCGFFSCFGLLAASWSLITMVVRVRVKETNDNKLLAAILAVALTSSSIGVLLLRPLFGRQTMVKQTNLAIQEVALWKSERPAIRITGEPTSGSNMDLANDWVESESVQSI